jgi:hypothetical protein
MTPLEPCPSCHRHVRVAEPSCPFCEALLPPEFHDRSPRPHPVHRLGRAALFAFGASVAATTACGSDDSDEKTGKTMTGETGGGGGSSGAATEPGSGGTNAGSGGGSAQALYGVPAPPDAGTDEGDPGPEPVPTVQPLYGAAPAD